MTLQRLLPTPTASPSEHGIETSQRRVASSERPPVSTSDVVLSLLPTPRATDGTHGGPNQRGSSGDLMLPSAVHSHDWAEYEPAIRRWEHILGRPAPPPTEPGRNGPRLNPRFVEWMMGLSAGHVTDTPGTSRKHALTILGNGVVPQQAAAATRAWASA